MNLGKHSAEAKFQVMIALSMDTTQRAQESWCSDVDKSTSRPQPNSPSIVTVEQGKGGTHLSGRDQEHINLGRTILSIFRADRCGQRKGLETILTAIFSLYLALTKNGSRPQLKERPLISLLLLKAVLYEGKL